MLQNLYQPERFIERQGPGRGPVWDLPPLRCPGPSWQPLALYASNRPAAGKVEHGEAARLVLAVIGRALRDARGRDLAERSAAITWLQSGEAAAWLALANRRITQADLDGYIAGCGIMPEKLTIQAAMNTDTLPLLEGI